MIVSFGDDLTGDLFHGRPTSRARRLPRDVANAAIIKLDLINAAAAIRDLRAPPGNRLEALKGDLDGLRSIRVNDRWRVVFRWADDDAHDVRLMDYHR